MLLIIKTDVCASFRFSSVHRKRSCQKTYVINVRKHVTLTVTSSRMRSLTWIQITNGNLLRCPRPPTSVPPNRLVTTITITTTTTTTTATMTMTMDPNRNDHTLNSNHHHRSNAIINIINNNTANQNFHRRPALKKLD